jgi:hypothetical protein
MKIKILILLTLMTSFGCSEKEVNPCTFLTLEEVQRIAPDARSHEYHPASTSKEKDNELCLWHDGGDQNVFMLFYYHSPYSNPRDLVRLGMPTGSRIIDVSGVGDAAAAGFVNDASNSNGSLKLFSAQVKNKTIGIRVRGITDESSENFELLKEIVNKALSRI